VVEAGLQGGYIRDGAMIAVEEINNKGGINGRPISLIIKDDKNTDEGITVTDKELIDEGVTVIIGHTYSHSPIKAYDYVRSKNTIPFTPYTATSKLTGKAVSLYRKNKDKINMVILDMILPDIGGGETYYKLKGINSGIRVLLSGGYSIDGLATEILNKGCNGFIQKPFNVGQLSQKNQRDFIRLKIPKAPD